MLNGTVRALWYGDSSALYINHENQDVDFIIETTGGADTFVVDAGNNRVGIGTTSPDYVLDVEAAGAAAARFLGENGSHGINVGGNDGGFGYIGHASSGAYDFQINSSGHVSIGAAIRLYLDGLGDTYISEYAANEMGFYTALPVT